MSRRQRRAASCRLVQALGPAPAGHQVGQAAPNPLLSVIRFFPQELKDS
jgi:hypothetical protein